MQDDHRGSSGVFEPASPSSPVAPSPTEDFEGRGSRAQETVRVKKPKEGGKAKSSQKRAVYEWTPWKDRIQRHKDAVLFVTTILSPGIQGSAAESPPSRCLLSASADGTVRVWGLLPGAQPVSRQKLALQPPIAGQNNVGLMGRPAARGHGGITAFAYQGKTADSAEAEDASAENLPIIYGGYESGRLAAWHTVSGLLVADLEGHTAPVTAMQCCTGAEISDGRRPCVVSASLDGSVRIWRSVEASALSAAGAGDEIGLKVEVKEQPADTIKRISELRESIYESLKMNKFAGAEEQNAVALVLSLAREFEASETVIAGLEVALNKRFPLRNGHDINTLMEMEDLMTAKCEEMEAATKVAEENKAVDDEDEGGPRCLFVLDFGVRNPVSDFMLLSSRNMVAGCWDGRLRHLNLRDRTCTNIVEVRSQMRVTCLCVPPRKPGAGEEVYVGIEDGTVACWNLAHSPGSPSHELVSWKAHAAATTKLQFVNYTGKFSSDAKRWLLSTSEDRTICIWAPDNGKLLKEFYGHAGGVLMMCLAAEERLIWSASRDHSVRSWCLEETETQLREKEAMEQADVESKQFEVWTAKNRQVQKSKKTAKKDKGGAASGKSPREKSPKTKATKKKKGA